MIRFLYIHPLGQGLALLIGFFNLVTGITGRLFNVAVHINAGILFYASSLLGAGIGAVVAKWSLQNGMRLDTDIHRFMAMVLVVMISTGATTGFLLLSEKKKTAQLAAIHKWANVILCIVFSVQAAAGIYILSAIP